MIIAIEGGDAAGKHTQAVALTQMLNDAKVEAETFDFPHYQSPTGGTLGRVLRGETMIVTHDDLLAAARADFDAEDGDHHSQLDLDVLAKAWGTDKAHLIQAAMLVNRLEHIELLLKYEHDRHRVLVLDRYTASGMVYGEVDGVTREWLHLIHVTLPKAGIQFLLDISVAESVRRRPERRDHYEKNLDKLKRVRDTYLRTFGAGGKHWHVLDGTQAPETITEYMFATTLNRLDDSVRARLGR